MQVTVKPELLQWAADRSGHDAAALDARFPQLAKWRDGTSTVTLRQLEDFARFTYTPVGFFFLPQPPRDTLPIPDMRTRADRPLQKPSVHLLDTIYLCQQRQTWYRDHALASGEPPCGFVGSATTDLAPEPAAEAIRKALSLSAYDRQHLKTWEAALRDFIAKAENAGILVMVNGVVGSNNRRRLDPDEFRGFALADTHAPLVFLNAADSKAAQMFTLAHELAHIWLGQSSLDDVDFKSTSTNPVETWCNRVAAELLVPLDTLLAEFSQAAPLAAETARLARHFKVSTLVVLRRIYEARLLTRDAYWKAYDDELQRLTRIPRNANGGDFYRLTTTRTSRRFARAVVTSTLEGRSQFTEAFRLLGFRKMASFDQLARNLGVIA